MRDDEEEIELLIKANDYNLILDSWGLNPIISSISQQIWRTATGIHIERIVISNGISLNEPLMPIFLKYCLTARE